MSEKVPEIVKICHFSDLHLPLQGTLRPWQLFSKRALGYANLRFNRGKTHKIEVLEELLNHLAAQDPDFVIMTGDVTSLALEQEFSFADSLFLRAGLDPDKVLLVPGNHDRYTPTSASKRAFDRGMKRWLKCDLEDGFPYLKTTGPVAVVGLDTAVWRGPLRAAGRIIRSKIYKLIETLNLDETKDKWPVIAIHHAPFHLTKAGFRDWQTGLEGVDDLLAALGDRPATLLHGHLHCLSRRHIRNLDIIGVSSASNDTGIARTQAAYHTFVFDRMGFKQASVTRHWPSESDTSKRFEIIDLPQEAVVD